MASADRSNIANAIWLCGNCHKLVDDDADRFPAGLLFEWQREHESNISMEIGKAGANLRARYERRHLEEFGKLSYLAERILTEKADHWEYRLTAEVLRYEMSPILQRWSALQRGLYIQKNTLVSLSDFNSWMSNRSAELNQMTHAFSELMNTDFARSWGEPGIAGDDRDIISTSRLFSEMCQSALTWEEAVRFSKVDKALEDVRLLYVGVGGYLIDEAAKVPAYLNDVFRDGNATGTFRLSLVLELPDGWADAVSAAYDRAIKILGY